MEIFQIKEMNIEFSLSSSFLFSAKAFIPPQVLKANKRKQTKKKCWEIDRDILQTAER